MGCIARLGCLFVLVALAVGGWFTRDMWLPHVVATCSTRRARRRAAGSLAATLRRRRGHDARRAGSAQRASRPGVRDVVAGGASRRTPTGRWRSGCRPPPTASKRSSTGDKLSMRAVVSVSESRRRVHRGGGIVHDRERVELTGTLDVLKPGVAGVRRLRREDSRAADPQRA